MCKVLPCLLAAAVVVTLSHAALAEDAGPPGPGPGRMLERLKEADANGDGMISKEEAPERMKQHFDRIDANGDGHLDLQELKQAIEARMKRPGRGGQGPGRQGPEGQGPEGQGPGRRGPGPAQMLERLKAADANGDGMISKEEAPEPLKRRFDRIDADGDGQLSKQELQTLGRRLMGRLGQGPPEGRRRFQRGGRRPDSAGRHVPENVIIQRDVEYGRADDRPLKMDIVRPKEPGETPLPAIVFIHGGGWRGGNKAGGVARLVPLAGGGNYFCASIDYRLSGEATWPAQIHDCKAAIRHLRANAEKYNIDPDRIGVWGTSAGGHLVNMLGTSGDVTDLEGSCGSPDQSSRVTCAVAFCGPSNLTVILPGSEHQGRKGNVVARLLGGPVEEKKDLAVSASPVTHVTEDDCPFLIVHGTDDRVVPVDQAETLHAALQKAGVDSTLVRVEGGGHGLGGPEITARVQAFLDKHLRGQDVEVSGDPIPAPHRGRRAEGRPRGRRPGPTEDTQ